MREWLMLAATFTPVVVLGLLERSGGDVSAWIRAVGLGWFVVGALILGWYDGWLKRALVGILIFIPLMATFVWWSGAVPSGWPAVITLVLVVGSSSILVLLGVRTGWFEELLDGFRRTFVKEPRGQGK